ncbi:hypothetical protein IAU59_006618 [Kwoniella sp. CBS 9459]
MQRLDEALLASVFGLLDPKGVLACAGTCRAWNHIVHTTAELQLELRQDLHQSGLYHGEKSYPIGERLKRLVTRETNIDLLRPRITKLHLPHDQILHTVSGRYVVTQPSDGDIEQRMGEDGKYELCTIWVRNVPKKVKVDFKPFTDLIDLDIHQDVIIVQVDQGRNNTLTKSDIQLRVFHLFNEGEDATEYEGGGIRITESDWIGPEPHNISLTDGGRVMVWCDGVVWFYDWRECRPIGRLPPLPNCVWRSSLGMAWAGNGMVLGLDMPHNPDTDLVQKVLADMTGLISSTLAIFEVDNTYPGTSSLPLLLELPFCIDLLTEVVRETLRLSDSDLITMDDEHIPHISRNGPFGLIVVATEFTINETIDMRIVIVLPVTNLARFDLEKTRARPNPFHAWGNEWDPFGDLYMVPFSDWRKHAYTWAEPKVSHSYHHGFYEAQHSLRLFSYNRAMLAQHGLLQLRVLDFNQKRLRFRKNDLHTLGGLGQEGSVEDQKDDSARREPINYRRAVIQPTRNNMGCVELQGDFMLGVDAAANVVTFCGERLFIQQRDRENTWILNFGVKEIAGKVGERPGIEDDSALRPHSTGPSTNVPTAKRAPISKLESTLASEPPDEHGASSSSAASGADGDARMDNPTGSGTETGRIKRKFVGDALSARGGNNEGEGEGQGQGQDEGESDQSPGEGYRKTKQRRVDCDSSDRPGSHTGDTGSTSGRRNRDVKAGPGPAVDPGGSSSIA